MSLISDTAIRRLWQLRPDIRYRFGCFFDFPQIAPPQLVEIARRRAERRWIKWEVDALQALHEHFVTVIAREGGLPGGVRYVNYLVEQAVQKVMSADADLVPTRSIDETILSNIIVTLENPPTADSVVHPSVDFAGVAAALRELDVLEGIESIRQDSHDLVDLTLYYRLIGRPYTSLLSHMVFTGNPGTGKTTVARILAKLYKALGLLRRGNLVETDRRDFIGQYIGHTAEKSAKVVESALGGVLFIDEAYGLVPDDPGRDFGTEALETILKRMEDHRGEFVVIVAGYPREMQHFIDHNPGLRSRFGLTYHFRDMTADELLRITEHMLEEEELWLDSDALTYLEEYFEHQVLHTDNSSGNARDVRNLVGLIVRTQNLRIIRDGDDDADPKEVILPDVLPHTKWTEERRSIGFTP